MIYSNQAEQLESVPQRTERPSWPDWTGKTVAILATGPSLTPQQVDHVHERRNADACRVIAINEAGLRQFLPLAAPWADMLYAADRHWWNHYLPEFYGMRVCADHKPPNTDVTMIKCHQSDVPVPTEPGEVLSGGHSGFQALNLALTLGAQRVVLFGYDCGGPKRNCHENRDPIFYRSGPPFDRWAEMYRRIAPAFPDRQVALCSPHSAITCFPQVNLEASI